MRRYEFDVLLSIDNSPFSAGHQPKSGRFVVYARDLAMARGILRGQAAIKGWGVLEIKQV